MDEQEAEGVLKRWCLIIGASVGLTVVAVIVAIYFFMFLKSAGVI